MKARRLSVVVACMGCLATSASRADAEEGRPEELKGVETSALPAEFDGSQMLAVDVRARVQAANLRESDAWGRVTSRAEWEAFRDRRIQALRAALGPGHDTPKALKVSVTRTLEGDGYRIENLVYESRPGLVVTANLYGPAAPSGRMPAIVIAHSHHNAKTQGELQDMGMTWARHGCLVLVPDLIGHGERRQHPFRTSDDYPRPFRAGRQDYYFRYNAGLQLQLAGESLMGWNVGDLMRGIDILLARPGVDRDRVILLGSVAGGGDPSGVASALDSRIKAVAAFNFGGPQPDYTLPGDAARDFYWFGVPDWESTRCLRLGARDGFAHWLIVASVAPRRLIYAHEFAWDPERDPVWPRLQAVFGWYGAGDHLAVATGRGSLKGSPPESSHCNNIGPIHRSAIYPALEHWFAMPIPDEYSQRRDPTELVCLTPDAIREFQPRPLHELAAETLSVRAAGALQRLSDTSPEERRQALRQDWARLLGDIDPKADPKVVASKSESLASAKVERIALEVERGILVPLVVLSPNSEPAIPRPIVVAVAQEGKQVFLEHRARAIAELLDGGAAVCLIDVRGTGETRLKSDSRRHSASSTSLSATEWMLGQTLVGSRLRDLRSSLRYLRRRPDVDATRIALWGDSFAPANPRDRPLAVPLDADPFPDLAEPLGGLLALFGALFESDVRVVYLRGGLVSYASLLRSPYCYVPHDALIPSALTAGDLCDVAAALAPRPLRMERLVDGLNQEVAPEAVRETFEYTRDSYRLAHSESRLSLEGDPSTVAASQWVLNGLRDGSLSDQSVSRRDSVSRDVFRNPFVIAALIAMTASQVRGEEPSERSTRPKEMIRLFNGKDLTGLTTWLKDTKHDDPRRVFRVADGVLQITGDGFGYVATEKAYRDYHLVVEYRWGVKTDGGRFVRNSGILLNAVGPDGGAGGSWMSSIECQLAQGCVGDLIVIRGKDSSGETIPVRLTSDVEVGPDRHPRWKEGGVPRVFEGGQLWWSQHEPGFKELLDTRGKDDVESPAGEWTRVDCVCEGAKLKIQVNGTIVNQAHDVNPDGGKLLLQSEGFELFVRTFELHPLNP